MDYITIASTGNAVDFGNLVGGRESPGGAGSSVRGIFAGGSASDVIGYITISSTGDAQDFGDLLAGATTITGCSNSTRCVFGGIRNPGYVTDMEFITIASTGNSQDFGDQTNNRGGTGGAASPTLVYGVVVMVVLHLEIHWIM